MIEKILGIVTAEVKLMTLNLTSLARLARCEEGHPMNDYYFAGPYFLPYAVVINDGPNTGRFQFLPYNKGTITVVRQGEDVLSGPMSGCWLAMFCWRGAQFVAHIGTESESQTGNFWTKVAWNDFVEQNAGSVEVIAGFNPYSAWRSSEPPKQGNDTYPRVFGLLTLDRSLYSIYTFRQDGNTDSHRIASVIKMGNGLFQGKYIPT
jgi:hypothetical protein